MKRRGNKILSFVLILSLIIGSAGTCAFAVGDTVGTDYQEYGDKVFASVDKIEIDYASNPSDPYIVVEATLQADTGGDGAPIGGKIEGGKYSAEVPGGTFSSDLDVLIHFPLTEDGKSTEDGIYNLWLCNYDYADGTGSLDFDKDYKVTFEIKNNVVQPGWDVVKVPYVMTASPSPAAIDAADFKDSGAYDAFAVTVKSEGTSALGEVTAALNGNDAVKFDISPASITFAGSSDSNVFEVIPSTGAITSLSWDGSTDQFDSMNLEAVLEIRHATAAALDIPVTFTVNPNTQAAPNRDLFTTTGVTSQDDNDGTIKGITIAMEYKLKSASSWEAGTGSDITNLASGTYEVRYKKVDATCTNPSPVTSVRVDGFYSLPSESVELKYGELYTSPDLRTLVQGGTSPFTISMDNGSVLPKGLTFNPATGVISGTPEVVTSSGLNASFTVTDATGSTTAGIYTFTVVKKDFNLNTDLTAKGSVTIEKNSALNLNSFFDLAVGAAAFSDKPADIVKDFNMSDNSKVIITKEVDGYKLTDGSIVVDKPADESTIESTTKTSITVSAIDAAANKGTYSYKIVVDSANETSDNYNLTGSITAEGTLTVNEKTNNGGNSTGGGGGGGGSNTTTYTVTFDAGEHGTVNGSKTMSVVDGGKVTKAPSVKSDLGWRFLGWSLDGKTKVTFGDLKIKENTTFKALYEEVKKEGTDSKYMNGYPDGTFRPDASISRAEVATMIAQMVQNFDSSTTYASDLSDLISGEWYVNYVNFCASKGLISGYEDGTFQPNKGITRAEFATIVAKYLSLENVGSGSFSDISGHWAEGYITQLNKKGIIHGYENNTFRPDAPISRAEAATMLNKAFDREPNQETVKANLGNYSVNLSDVTPEHWAYYQILEAAVAHAAADFHK